jgi:hypothetical protein
VSPPCSLPISMGGQIKAVERLAPADSSINVVPALANEFQVRTCRRTVELVLESIFVCETIEADRRRIIRGGKHGAIPLFAVEETFAVLRTRRKLPS